ncbi:hypothetical protein Cgig2_024583 [Carnegiea gigantea]|uniref:Uncharacterized protein n=1 Tax=Carnegiea gigantea TaxID=171969 RepID=A0A9Q1KKB0_9CARY|nr:hypothetical protein Cgig2_024583 [Carnegiea gigantea]
MASCGLIYNDFALVRGLLEVEDALVGLLRIEKENDLIENGSWFILDRRSLYENSTSGLDEYASGLDEAFKSEVHEAFKSVVLTEYEEDLESEYYPQDLFDHIVWAPRIWNLLCFLFHSIIRTTELGFPYWARSLQDKWIIYDEDELQDSEFLQSGTLPYLARARSLNEQGFFALTRFIWDPTDPIYFLFEDEDELPVSVFSNQEFFADEEIGLLISKKQPSKYMKVSWFIHNQKEKDKHFELLIDSQRWIRSNSSLFQ